MANSARHAAPSAFGLGLIVFAAGACLMCVEIVGAMVIAPYFGSNVFVWGSIITVFMGALSLGYVLGGRVADARPGAWVLSVLPAGAGVFVVLIPLAGPAVCQALLGLDLGTAFNRLLPMLAVVLLFFLPSMLLGMIVPVAVRIAATALSSVGRVVGKLYALNALGSVAGALGATFLLVPFVGNRAVLLGCGAVLALGALVCRWLERDAGPAVPSPPGDRPAPESRPVPGLRPLLFGCGVVFMGLQIIGGMVVAPYFGSTVYVWGSVITLFLCALSVGYRLGGRLADRRPTMMTLATVVVAAGIAVQLIAFIAPAVCALSSAILPGSALRALFASLVLYAVPTVLLAMVSPFAVRLSTARVDAVGGVVGRLYALSTLGNVAGALGATFVLISVVGKTRLLAVGGFITVLLAVLAVFVNNRARGEKRQPVLVSILLLAGVAGLAAVPKPALVPIVDRTEEIVGSVPGGWSVVRYGEDYFVLRRVRAERESPYHHVAIIEEKALPVGRELKTTEGRTFLVGRTTRYGNRRDLRFDQYVESSVLLDETGDKIREPYTSGTTYSDLLHLPLIFNPRVRDVLIIGGGGGVVPMTFRLSYEQMSIDVVEIDPVVAQVAQEWFGFRPDERHLRLYVGDGRMFIHNAKKTYDLIILDAYTAGGRIPFHLTTQEFLTKVRELLRPRGVVLMNVISAIEGRASALLRAQYKTFKEVFGRESVYVFPKLSDDSWKLDVSRNVMLVAAGPGHPRRLTYGEVTGLAEKLVARGTIKIGTVPEHAANMFTDAQLAEIPQDDVPVLTDDYAPVDTMAVE